MTQYCEHHPRIPAIGDTMLLNDEEELESFFLCEKCFRRLAQNDHLADLAIESHLEKKAEQDGEEKFAFYVIRKDVEKGGIDVIPITTFDEVNPMIHNSDSEVLGVKEYPTLMNLYQAKQYIWDNFEAEEYIE